MDKLRRVIPGNRRIFVRNFICVLLVVLLFSCVVIAVYQHQIHQMILSDVGVLNLSTLEKNIQTIDGVMLSLRELAYTVSSEQSMLAFLAGTPQVDAMRRLFEENVDQAEKLLAYYRLSSPYVENVYVYSPRMGRLISSTKRGAAGSDALLSEAWHKAAAQSDAVGKISVFFQRWRGSYPYLVTIMRTMAGANGTAAGYVMVDVNVEKLGALVLGNFPDKENTRLFIVDSSGQMLLSTPYYLLGESDALPESLQRFAGEEAGFSEMTLIEGEEYVVSCQDSAQEGWRYILIRPYDRYFALTSRGELIFSLMIALVFVLVLLVGLVIASTTFQPLERIITAIEEPAAPPAPARSGKGMQEVERVIQSVYDLKESNTAMQSRLNEQLHEFSLEQVRALQHQMDPHFLYNVLDYFRWEAIDALGEGSALEEMARTLSEYFHIALRRSDYLVPLRDELHHIELFMQLYAYRYEGRLQVHTDVPEDMMDARVLKLSVQPIVDNAIKHGLRPRRYRGNIWIGARREDGCILVTVENDGERMDEAELARVNAQLAHPEASNLDEHIGLNNIARRIRLLFGEGYGVSLSNTEAGMIAVMRLPESISNTAGESDKKGS